VSENFETLESKQLQFPVLDKYVDCPKHGKSSWIQFEHVPPDPEPFIMAFCVRCLAELIGKSIPSLEVKRD
jgi:hypothetical protein